jgi:hypothetical protein
MNNLWFSFVAESSLKRLSVRPPWVFGRERFHTIGRESQL